MLISTLISLLQHSHTVWHILSVQQINPDGIAGRYSSSCAGKRFINKYWRFNKVFNKVISMHGE